MTMPSEIKWHQQGEGIGQKWMSTSIKSIVVPTRSNGMCNSCLPSLRKPNPGANNLPMTAQSGCAGIATNRYVPANTANSHTSARTVDTATQSDSALVLRGSKVATWYLRELECCYIISYYNHSELLWCYISIDM